MVDICANLGFETEIKVYFIHFEQETYANLESRRDQANINEEL